MKDEEVIKNIKDNTKEYIDFNTEDVEVIDNTIIINNFEKYNNIDEDLLSEIISDILIDIFDRYVYVNVYNSKLIIDIEK